MNVVGKVGQMHAILRGVYVLSSRLSRDQPNIV